MNGRAAHCNTEGELAMDRCPGQCPVWGLQRTNCFKIGNPVGLMTLTILSSFLPHFLFIFLKFYLSIYLLSSFLSQKDVWKELESLSCHYIKKGKLTEDFGLPQFSPTAHQNLSSLPNIDIWSAYQNNVLWFYAVNCHWTNIFQPNQYLSTSVNVCTSSFKCCSLLLKDCWSGSL
jgi:hypothetical protein